MAVAADGRVASAAHRQITAREGTTDRAGLDMSLRRRALSLATAVLLFAASTPIEAFAASVQAVSFSDSTHGLISGVYGNQTGFVSVSSDGGVTWHAVRVQPGAAYLAGALAPGGTLALVPNWYGGTVLRSPDFGGNWASYALPVGSPSGAQVLGVSMGDATHGWAVGSANFQGTCASIFNTNDGGLTWSKGFEGPLYPPPTPEEEPPATNAVMNGVDGVDGSVAYAVGHEYSPTARSLVYKTSDGGSTWTTMYAGTTSPWSLYAMAAVSAPDSGTVYIAGPKKIIRKSTDSGANWTQVSAGTISETRRFAGISMATTQVGWAVGSWGAAQDLGIIWRLSEGGPSEQVASGIPPLYDVTAIDTMTAIAVGENETILRTADGGGTWTGSTGAAPPSVAIVSPPSSGVATGASASINGTATDGRGVGVADVDVRIRRNTGEYWNGTAWVSGETWLQAQTVDGWDHWAYAWSLLPGQSGEYTHSIDWRAIDAAGNEATAAGTTGVRVDNVIPTLLSVQPIDGTHLRATFSEALATGSASSAKFTLDSGGTVSGASVVTTAPTQVVVTTSQLSSGVTYTLSAASGAVRDAAGNPSASGSGQFGVNAGLTFAKSVSATEVAAGTAINCTYTVNNTGNVSLASVSVVDDRLGAVFSGVSLGAGASFTATRSTVPTETRSGVATATGTDVVLGSLLTANAGATVAVRHPSIDITKTADAADVATGTTVNYTYQVRNTGDVTLHGGTVVDDKLGPIGSFAMLAPGASSVFNDSQALNQDTTNIATVTASYGTSGTPFYGTVSAVDAASVNVVAAALDVQLVADHAVVLADTDVLYTYTVTNTGDYALSGVTVSDNVLGSIITSRTLNVGQSATATRTEPVSSDVTHNATASGAFEGVPAGDSASVFVDVVAPGVSVAKSADTSRAAAGQTVRYTYTATNSGDTTLTGVRLVDDKIGVVPAGWTLAPGASRTTSATSVLSTTTKNIVAVTATDSALGGPVSAQASATVVVRRPALTLSKTADATLVASGTTVDYAYVITNTGDETLYGGTVVDDKLGPIGSFAMLAPGAFSVFNDSQALTQDTTNIATVTASYGTSGTPFYGAVSATDAVFVDVPAPAVSVTKAVDRTSIYTNEQVTYTFTVTNSGDTALAGVTLSDEALGSLGSTSSIPAGGTWVVTRSVALSASQSAAASVTAECAVLPGTYVTSRSATVTVTVSSPPPPPPPVYEPPPVVVPVTPALPGHTLYTPVAPSTVYYGRTFTMYGFLKPRHKAGLYSVKLEGYRYERQSNGTYKWVRRATWYAKNYNYSTYTKSIKTGAVLKLRGKWKVRAVHTHTGYLPKYSGYRYFYVR
ncbi:MAG: hypothetical protein C0418_04480 [Coriobacteriaceae bacterium]|nr:hypothetical protein [Coriobacteriaceae bacterium]